MSTVAPVEQQPAPARSADPGTRPTESWLAGQWQRPLWQHAAALAIVLLALMPLLGTNRLFHVDEGATLAQTELLARGDGWTYEHPRSDLDPTDRWSPLWPSTGNGSAPLAKHPLYSLLLTPGTVLLGPTGAVLMALLGAWGASILAALIARRLGDGLDRPTLWITALVSPMFVYGFVTIAHTLGALAAGGAALAALIGLERPGPRSVAIIGLLSFATVMLRSEGVMFTLALAAALVVLAIRDRRRSVLVLATVVGGSGLFGYLVADPWLTTHLVSATDPFIIDQTRDSQGPYLTGRIQPTVITMFLPGYAALGGIGGMLSATSAAMAAAAAWVIRRRPEDTSGIRLFVVAAAGTAVVRLVLPPAVIPGLLVAFPLILPGLLLLRRPLLTRSTTVLLGITYVLFIGMVLATQYRLGGTGEWGFRYAIVGLPVAVPLVVAGLRSAVPELDASTRRLAVSAVVVLSGALCVLAMGALRSPQQGSEDLVHAVEDARAGANRPVVVTNDQTVPRFAWKQVLSGESWLTVPNDEMPDVVSALAEDGGDVVLVSEDVDEQLPAFAATHRVVSRTEADLSADREIVVLTPS